MPRFVTGLSSLTSIKTPRRKAEGEIFPARVSFVILDNKTEPEIFKKFGEWSSIGSILFSKISSPTGKNLSNKNFAKPLFPNNKVFPIENEIVYILTLPNSNVQSSVSDVAYYYFQPINIWNSVHHNAIPDPIHDDTFPASQQQDYQQTSVGAARRVTDGGTEIDLGGTFKERIDIRNLQPYEGDIFYEGRWGQSVRFGSTVKNSKIPNPWSNSGEDGDPIIIIRNGQYNEDVDSWIPQVENINKDKSSIYITSTQQIPIEAASKDYSSYSEAPTVPEDFTGEQIILNSGRLFLNSKSDSILLSAQKSVNLNSVDSVNVDSKKFVASTNSGENSVLLGSKGATEPIILGDTFLEDFEALLSQLIEVCKTLQIPMLTNLNNFTNVDLTIQAPILLRRAAKMKGRINDYKSKVSKTK